MDNSAKAELQFSHSMNYCECGKPIYDKKTAQTAANKRMRDSHKLLRIYHCDLSNGWHLTSLIKHGYRK